MTDTLLTALAVGMAVLLVAGVVLYVLLSQSPWDEWDEIAADPDDAEPDDAVPDIKDEKRAKTCH
ncbi:hypothetical protein [Flavimaricola marinus]|uniref:Uncharacterized protein n=1 Tax=Flavimaricola marinus TaxID=1819565 RepID=A0A238LM44_9RHOB|nr:hypothetical protein [Flavimaricola marinus]SMY09920.1 hypothetical protein LOM8899_04093 [Flavimaricola marinus]